ncbi:enoyl-CoA hydratase domain-containing protein 3, mitochondrial [Caerostris extrusa]|uniref:Enoyl-CoA hydratase domain-containing protein 3, mitochondrial n=1 Tax=Caerostris extrusa TaxID=172846 RepID=A0AAV4W9A3_CAEEX|nr:enoyl-CoA hydratase domain-containing protein 3, mitochondrial [Caerostris extrusa]
MALFRKSKVLSSFLIRRCSNLSNLTIVSVDKGVKRITLNNPKKRNALSSAMLDQLERDIFDDAQDVNLRCIVLQSNGPVFSSGHDLKELYNSDQKTREEIFKKCSEVMVGIRNVPVPVIAVVNGLAAAAGCQLVASCDISIASSKSQFSTPGASVGLFCSTPGIAVSRNVPLKIASYMLLTGNNLIAKDAIQAGLISRMVEEQELEIETEKSEGSNVMVKNLSHKEAKEAYTIDVVSRTPTIKRPQESPTEGELAKYEENTSLFEINIGISKYKVGVLESYSDASHITGHSITGIVCWWSHFQTESKPVHSNHFSLQKEIVAVIKAVRELV